MSVLPNIVHVDLRSLSHNVRQVRAMLRPGTRIMGIVKSDAYGHGLLRVARTLQEEGVEYLGVAQLHEALELRRNGLGCPIVVLSGIRGEEEAREVMEKGLIAVLFDPDQAEALSRQYVREGKRPTVLVKIDTGMGRLGLAHQDVGGFIQKIVGTKGLHVDGLMSHLSSADEPQREFTEKQIGDFRKAIETGRALGLELRLNTLANSAGIMAYADSHFDMVRPGIMLYGGLPSPDFRAPMPLRPVMGFSGRVLQVRDFPDGTPVSYGRTHHTKGPRRVAILSAGYGNGIPRSLSNTGQVLIGGRRCPILGRVCMNLIVADITRVEDVLAGGQAVFLGSQGEETITGDEMARWAETISYEIFCSIGQRNVKEYVG